MTDASQRRDAAREMAAMAEAGRRREAAAAQVLIDQFVVDARAAGLASEPLRATLLGGGTAKTDRRGWYVNAKQTLAIGENGEWYTLVVPGSLKARFTGVSLQPSDPVLDVGRGARDGESGDLRDFLARMLGEQP